MPITNKQAINLNTLYRIDYINSDLALGVFSPSIFINGGIVNLGSSGSLTQPTLQTQMIVSAGDANVSGYCAFSTILPTYIYITQVSGSTTEIVLDGLQATALGALS